jgi:hypothetical protein
MPWVEKQEAMTINRDPRPSRGQWVEKQEPRSMGQELGRQAGLGVRMIAEGASALPLMVGDAANAAVNLGVRGVNKMAGTDIPQLRAPSEVMQSGMKSMGVPQPENIYERIANALGNAGTGWGAASAAQGAVQGVRGIEPIVRELAKGPALQAAGATGGVLATEGARSGGVDNPYALAGIGLIGSIAPGGAATVAQRTAQGTAQMARPLMQSGQEIIAGKVLNRLATNPTVAANRLADAGEIVPGSRPTVAQGSRDPGLIISETAVKGMDERGLLAQRSSEQNQARMQEFERIARDENTLKNATRKRDKTYEEIAGPAFRSKQPIATGPTPVLEVIQQIRATPAGARQTVKSAMDEAEAALTQEGADLTDASVLYEIRKDLALAKNGKLTGRGKTGAELSNLKQAKSQLSDVINKLDDVIEIGAPGFKDYMSLYEKRSIPLDQLKALQDLRRRSVLNISDPVTGEPILGAKFSGLLRNNLDNGLKLRGKGPKEGKLSEQQLATLDRISQDLDRGAAGSASTMRVPGSDTFRNLSVASIIGSVVGDNAADLAKQSGTLQTAMRPLSFLYQVPDQQIQQLIVEAYLDPRLASKLMRNASQANIESVAAELNNRLNRQVAGQALYGAE